MDSLENFIKNNRDKLYLLLALLVLADRFLLLHYFGFRYTGSDDTVLWQGANDYLHGIFHEPFFYGQDYNYMTEALFAVPLLFAGIDVHLALPLVTSFMALFPFFTFSYANYKRENFIGAFAILSVPLFLPVEYGMLTSMSRGFVNGIFFLSFIPLLFGEKLNPIKYLFIGFFSALAVVVNPNSLVAAIPILAIIFLTHYKKIGFYFFISIGIILVLFIHYNSLNFYLLHPENKIHGLGEYRMQFHMELIAEGLNKLNLMFLYLSPIFWHYGGLSLFILAGLILLLFLQKKYLYAIAALSSLAVILFSFGFGKVHDGFDHVLLPVSRMFLAIPLLYGIFISWITENINKNRWVWILIIIMPDIVFFIHKTSITERRVRSALRNEDYGYLAIISVDTLKHDCFELNELAKKNQADIIIFLSGGEYSTSYMELRNYGCPILTQEFTPSMLPHNDRRTWLLQAEEKIIRKNILFVGDDYFKNKFLEKKINVTKRFSHPDVFLLQNNSVNVLELLDKIDFPVRTH